MNLTLDPLSPTGVRVLDPPQVTAVGSSGNSTSSASLVPQYENTDKPSPVAGDLWVKHTTASGGGSPIGLLLALTNAGSGSETYELSYYTNESTIKRVALA